MRVIDALRRLVRNSDYAPDIASGISNLAGLINDKLGELIEANRAVSDRLDRLREAMSVADASISERLDRLCEAMSVADASISERLDRLRKTVSTADSSLAHELSQLKKNLSETMELQRAQVVMSKDQTEAIEGLSAAIDQFSTASSVEIGNRSKDIKLTSVGHGD